MVGVVHEQFEGIEEAAEGYAEFVASIQKGDWSQARTEFITCGAEIGCASWICDADLCYKSRRIVSELEVNGFAESMLQLPREAAGEDLTFTKVSPAVKVIKKRNGKYTRRLQHDGECDHGDGDMSSYNHTCGCCIPQPKIATRILMEVMKWTGLKGWPEDLVYEVLKQRLPGIFEKLADGMNAMHNQPRKYHCELAALICLHHYEI